MIHIVCTMDDNYMQHCAAMLNSLLSNNKKQTFTIHIVHPNAKESNLTNLKNLFKIYKTDSFYYNIDSSIMDGAPIKKIDHVTIATYFRILLPDILPSDLSKVLYLDPDMIVLDNIEELWNTDIENVAFGATQGLGGGLASKILNNIPLEKDYFNAGLLLINLDYWKERNVKNRVLSYIAENQNKLLYHDQDALNAVLYNEWKKLNVRWNVQSPYFEKLHFFVRENKLSSEDIFLLIKQNCSIVHYTGSVTSKPWYKDCIHPLKDEYWKHLRATPWKDCKPMATSPFRKIKNRIWSLIRL